MGNYQYKQNFNHYSNVQKLHKVPGRQELQIHGKKKQKIPIEIKGIAKVTRENIILDKILILDKKKTISKSK